MADRPGPEDLAALVPPDWADTFRRVPRELFVPDAVKVSPTEGSARWVDRTQDPNAWRAAVYSDAVLVTQIADGGVELTAETVQGGEPTSSSTLPSLVGEFLELLEPYPGDRVLEIGTGTGWTAGLLSEYLGAENVVSVEVDEQVAKEAAEHLGRAGYRPTLVVGDGLRGSPEHAPYDRVHVTCSVREVPFTWVEQIRPGGVIVAPWVPTHLRGHKLKLTVTGEEAIGRFHGPTAFMMARAQRPGLPQFRGEARESRARIDPTRITHAAPGLELVVAGLLPGVEVNRIGGRSDRVGLHDPVTGSYALAVRTESGSAVTEYGDRALWPELEEAYLAWVRLGEPDLSRFGLVVDSGGQQVWLDEPHNRVR